MADDKNIKVNLEILQAKELNRLKDFTDAFQRSVDSLNQGFESRLSKMSRLASSASQGSASTPSGGGRSTSGPAQTHSGDRSDELKGKARAYDASQARIEETRDRIARTISGIGASSSRNPGVVSRWASTWSQSPSALTEMEQASIRLQAGGPLRAQDVLRNISYQIGGHAENLENLGKSSRGWTLAGASAGAGARVMSQMDHAGQMGSSLSGVIDRAFNTRLMDTSKAYGYGRGSGLMGMTVGEGWREGASNWWLAKKKGWFGLRPTVHGEEDTMAAFEQLGISTTNGRGEQYYNDIVDLSSKMGLKGSELATRLESTRRNNPSEIPQAMKEIEKMGKAALKAGYNLEVLTENAFSAAEQLGQQYGRSSTHYLGSLRRATEKTGLLPTAISQMLSDPNQVYVAAAQMGKRPEQVMRNPELMVQAKLQQAEVVSGTNISGYGSMSKKERRAAEDQWSKFMLMPGADQFTGGLTFEQFMGFSAQQKMTDSSRKTAAKYLNSQGMADSASKISDKELNKALDLAYNGDKDAIAMWKASNKGLKREDKIRDLGSKVGSKNAHKTPGLEIKFAGSAKKFLKWAHVTPGDEIEVFKRNGKVVQAFFNDLGGD